MPTEIAYGGCTDQVQGSSFGYGTGYSSLAVGDALDRMKVDGIITQIRSQNWSSGTLNSVRVRVWRDDDTADLDCALYVGESTVPSNQLAHDTWTYLDTPIRCRAGDAIGIRFDAPDSHASGPSTTSVGWYENTDKGEGDDGDWANSLTTRPFQVAVRGYAADLISFGDSVSYGSSGDSDRWASALQSDFYSATRRSYAHNVANLIREDARLHHSMATGAPSQRASWGVTNWSSRVAAYAADRAIVVCNFGVNDLIAFGEAIQTHKGHWESLRKLAADDGLILVRQNLLHVASGYSYGGYGAAHWNAEIDAYNTAMAEWCANRGILNIDVCSHLNDSHISSDNLHPNQSGYELLGKIVGATIHEQKPAGIDGLRLRAGGAEISHLHAVGTLNGVVIQQVAAKNGPGTGLITASGDGQELTWTAPGASAAGPAIVCDAPGEYVLAGDDATKWIRAYIWPDYLPDGGGEASVLLADRFNNAVAHDDVTAAEAAAGDTETYEITLHNASPNNLLDVRCWLDAATDDLEISTDGVTYYTPDSEDHANVLIWPTLPAGEEETLYLKRVIASSTPRDAEVLNHLHLAFDG